MTEANCGACWSCVPDFQFMMLCVICGNKRCPHANNHENDCTSSNEPRQKGSAYEFAADPLDPSTWPPAARTYSGSIYLGLYDTHQDTS